MVGHFGFSYIGLIFLLMLLIPNFAWTKKQPQGYTAENENKILLALERIGEVLTSCCALIFADFNVHGWTNWSWWLIAAFILMLIYELWWIRYFRSERRLEDFYSSFLSVPPCGSDAACYRLCPAWYIREGRLDVDFRCHFRNRAYWNSYTTPK